MATRRNCLTTSHLPSGGLAAACRVTASLAATIMEKTGGCVPATSDGHAHPGRDSQRACSVGPWERIESLSRGQSRNTSDVHHVLSFQNSSGFDRNRFAQIAVLF